MRALELYAGIGGFAAAARGRHEIVCAVEQSDVALAVYRANYPSHPTLEKNISGFSIDDFAAFDAELWWLSPPCQPFTKRGLRADADDPRTRSFFKVLEAIRVLRPRAIALENVPEFAGSQTHAALLESLRGYSVNERQLCPTELGIPNRRLRYYLVASTDPLREMVYEVVARRLASYTIETSEDFDVSAEDLSRYHRAMSIIDPARDASAVASCFTSAYGRSPAKSGSFLRTPRGARRFSPRELLDLFGFPPDFRVPAPSLERVYGLIGNSLNVHAVRAILRAFD